jgi:transposase
VRRDVVAPSLIPKGARRPHQETDKRDRLRLARLHRAGELVAIRTPQPAPNQLSKSTVEPEGCFEREQVTLRV